MPALSKKKNVKRIINSPKESSVESAYTQCFSKKFYDSIVISAFKMLKIKTENIKRVSQYISEDGGHTMVTVMWKRSKQITPSEITLFKKEMKKKLTSAGYAGSIQLKKQQKLLGLRRKAVESPLLWKSTSVGGCWSLNFERLS